jgi:hypothetical protein
MFDSEKSKRALLFGSKGEFTITGLAMPTERWR